MALTGREQVEPLYQHWSETNQTIFFIEEEQIAVGDDTVGSRTLGYQKVLGADLSLPGVEADPEAMYLVRARVAMIWPYDEQCRLVGENVWEYDESARQVFKLDPADALTTDRAAVLLDPYIRDLPEFTDELLAP